MKDLANPTTVRAQWLATDVPRPWKSLELTPGTHQDEVPGKSTKKICSHQPMADPLECQVDLQAKVQGWPFTPTFLLGRGH